MPTAKHDHNKMVATLLDDQKPLELRAHVLVSALQSGNAAAAQSLAMALLRKMSAAGPAAKVEELRASLEQALKELQQGGVRPATFIGAADAQMPGPKPRAHVVTPDGQQRFPFCHPELKLEELRPGDTVYLDANGAVVLAASRTTPTVGPQAGFLRRIPDSDLFEVSIQDQPVTLYAASDVLAAQERGELRRGDQVLICPNRQFAFVPVPRDNDRRYRFVDRSRLPEVLPGRDIGNPHWCLYWLVYRTRILLFRDDLAKRFGQRPRVSLLMTGPSGTGKTLTIKAYLTLFRRMLAERTKRDDVGSRVIRVKMSEQLSEWLGRSDKNFDQLFDDIQHLAAEKVQTADGQWIRLPVVVIFEEVESIARRRAGGDHDGTGGAMDRILGTLLQRLDDPMDELAQLPLIFLSTTNRPSLLDTAMHRRLGSRVARFKRLDRHGLAAVLDKKVKPHYPLAPNGRASRAKRRQQLIDEVVADLFSPNSDDAGLVEITLRDGTKVVKHWRDFLTGAVVEQALAEAIDELTFYAEQAGTDDVGLSSGCLIQSLRRQIAALAENVTAYNAADYFDVPEHTHVANVRHLRGSNGRLRHLIADHQN